MIANDGRKVVPVLGVVVQEERPLVVLWSLGAMCVDRSGAVDAM